MTLALWVVGAYVLIVYAGTFALQLALWLLQAAWLVLTWTVTLLGGLVGTLCLALFDRAELKRIWREDRAQAKVAETLARERWS